MKRHVFDLAEMRKMQKKALPRERLRRLRLTSSSDVLDLLRHLEFKEYLIQKLLWRLDGSPR